MDSGIKLLLTIVLAIIPFSIASVSEYVTFCGFILVVTVLLRIRSFTLVRNIAVYFLVIVFPYVFGLGMVTLLYWLTGNTTFYAIESISIVGLRLFQLFLLWYITSLYFMTTPTEQVLGLFDKLLSPLKKMGLSTTNYLLMIMFVIRDLTQSGPKIKQQLTADYKERKGIVNIVVGLLVSSFERMDEIAKELSETPAEQFFSYTFTVSRVDLLATSSTFVFLGWLVL